MRRSLRLLALPLLLAAVACGEDDPRLERAFTHRDPLVTGGTLVFWRGPWLRPPGPRLGT